MSNQKTQKRNRKEENLVTSLVSSDEITLTWHALQSVGMERSHNEDALFALDFAFQNSNKPVKMGIFIVADGMGGHQHGELASTYAIQAATERLLQEIPLLMKNDSFQLNPEGLLQQAADAAQQTVLHSVPGSGTTFSALLVTPGMVTIAHVGDSRIYQVEPGKGLTLLTRDHTLVRRLVDLGHLSLQEAQNHPQKNVLFRAIGQSDGFKVDLSSIPLHQPTMFMICSDGLWGQVNDNQLYSILESHHFNLDACDTLVQAANDSGGPDNISVILVKIT